MITKTVKRSGKVVVVATITVCLIIWLTQNCCCFGFTTTFVRYPIHFGKVNNNINININKGIAVVVIQATTTTTSLASSSTSTSSSTITDWVTENLESGNSQVTWSSKTTAGENDTLPETGLCIGKVRIFAADADVTTTSSSSNNTIKQQLQQLQDSYIPIKLLVGRNGWGTGVHPTTRLCIEYLCNSNIINGGEIILDYGCGSGILSITALHMGASKCIGVDIEAEALITAERNLQLNGYYGTDKFEPYHTREVVPYNLYPSSNGVDICIANILIGQLVRTSMIVALTTNVRPGGIICFSGIRPNEVESLKQAYSNYIDQWLDTQYAELHSSDCVGSIESYGYDCGIWCRVVGRTKTSSNHEDDILAMSEQAVS